MKLIIMKYQNQIKVFLGMLLIALCTVTVFSMTTSPLYPEYYSGYATYSSAENMVVAQGLTQGLVPYKDLFGTSGPIFYFLEVFVLGLFGRNGVFSLQIVLLAVTLFLMHQFAKEEVPAYMNWLGIVVSLVVYIAAVKTGNIIEEFCLPLMAALIYFGKSDRYLLKGLLLGLLLWTNWLWAIPFFAVHLYELFCVKNWKNVMKYIAGVLVVTLPVLIYFMAVNAVGEMAKGVFLYPISDIIMNAGQLRIFARKLVKSLPVIIYIVTILKVRNENLKKELLFAILFLIVLLLRPYEWECYAVQMIVLPCIILLSAKSKIWNLGILILTTAMFAITLIPYGKHVISTIQNPTYKEANEFIKAEVEEYNKKDFIVVDANPALYLLADKTPEYRYFSNQSHICQLKGFEDVTEEIQEYTLSDNVDFMILRVHGFVPVEYGKIALCVIERFENYGNIAMYH